MGKFTDQIPYEGQAEIGASGTVLDLPISDLGRGEIYKSITHCDVVYRPEGIFGYKYWMVATPYPDINRELPEVYCSHDGVKWYPGASPNPIALKQEAVTALGANSWLADPDMVYVDSQDKLYCFYCRFSTALDWQWVLRTSSNGVTWSAPTVVLSGTTPTSHSPAFVYEGGTEMSAFYVKGLSGGTPTIHYRTSGDLGLSWGAEQNCVFPKCSDNRPDFWHMDVIKVGGKYHALVLGKHTAESFLWHYTSDDKLNWTLMCHTPAIGYSGNPLFDGTQNYRSSFIAREGGSFDLFIVGQPRGATSDDANTWPDLAVTANTGTDFFTTVSGQAHCYDNGDAIKFVSGTLPTGVSLNTQYFIRDRTNLTFKVAATKGGAAIDLTVSNGSNIRVSLNPWRIALYRNTKLPFVPSVITPRSAFTNVNPEGASLIPVANSINTVIAAWPNANFGFAQRFSVSVPTEFRYVRYPCGANGTANIEVGVLRITGGNRMTVAPLITSGVIAAPAPSGGSSRVDLGKFVLAPGEYWLWFWADHVSLTVPAAAIGYGGVFTVAQLNVVAAGGRAMPIIGATLDSTGGRAISHYMLEGDYS